MIMKCYYQSVKINHNANWPYIPDNRYRILIIDGSKSGKKKHQRPDIDKIYLYGKDPFDWKYDCFSTKEKKYG